MSAEGVALLPAVSVGVGLVAAALGPGDEVVVPVDEFESVLFPLLVAEQRGAVVRRVPFGELADAIRPSTTLVAFSLVQMQTGLRADLAAISRSRQGRRRADPGRCDAGHPVPSIAVRTWRPPTTRGLRGVQAPPLPARDGVHARPP